MEYKRYGQCIVMRIDRGEEILECIKLLCESECIQLAQFSGIGAVNAVKMGLFETAVKAYHSEEFKGDFEISSLSGNITRMDDEVYIHAHICIADRECKTFGGHLNRAVVSATAEFIIRCIDGSTGRKFSDEIGLNLLDWS